MTFKQRKTIEVLPKNNYNLSKSMREGGYTEQTSRSGTQYKRLREVTRKIGFLEPSKISEDMESTYKEANSIPEIKDRVAAKTRIEEHRAKVAGMVKDNNTNQAIEKLTIVYGNKEITQSPKAQEVTSNIPS